MPDEITHSFYLIELLDYMRNNNLKISVTSNSIVNSTFSGQLKRTLVCSTNKLLLLTDNESFLINAIDIDEIMLIEEGIKIIMTNKKTAYILHLSSECKEIAIDIAYEYGYNIIIS